MKVYIIVKHAGKHWSSFFEEDPKKFLVDISFSAYYSYTGKKCGIKEFYTDKKHAEIDCWKMNAENPFGDYAVCPTNEKSVVELQNKMEVYYGEKDISKTK
jgi:predicted nucleic-acid-binding Zn-ribbon protein